jgi:hypothetical protein
MVCSFAYSASAAPPVVSGITASQRANTKIVDVTYNLTLDAGQKAFVELWFSPDNGLTFPVRCVDVSGHVDSNVTDGNSKAVEWNAESDWNQQFTAHGKIRVIATYGDQPSGFSGSGNAGAGNNGGAYADESLVAIPWDVLWIPNGAGTGYSNQTQMNVHWNTGEVMFTKINVDPEEITNEKWNVVADWARDNGYPGLPDAPANAVEDEPRTGITFWEALKWCNARSEMDGLEPAYYIDASEAIGDLNGDGAITAGTDVFDPHDPISSQDTNGNGKWDQGEPFTDNPPQNGTYEPQEYVDVNGNGQFDEGLSTVFRAGANVAGFGTQLQAPGGGFNAPTVSGSPIKRNANGYRLPFGPVFHKLATGGNHQKKWPWGDENPPGSGGAEYGQFSDYVLAGNANDPANLPTKPTSASNRQANGYGLKDLIGNVAEWTEDAWEEPILGTPQVVAYVYGGSYLGLEFADEGDGGAIRAFENTSGQAVTNLFGLELRGPASETSPAIGFRCVTYE